MLECGVREESGRRIQGKSVQLLGVLICILYKSLSKASHLYEDYLCTGETAIMMHADTKKDAHARVEIHYT